MHGEKGSIELRNAFGYVGGYLEGLGNVKVAPAKTPEVETELFQLEAEHFAECVRGGGEPRTPGEEGLKDMVAIEAIYKAAGAPIA